MEGALHLKFGKNQVMDIAQARDATLGVNAAADVKELKSLNDLFIN